MNYKLRFNRFIFLQYFKSTAKNNREIEKKGIMLIEIFVSKKIKKTYYIPNINKCKEQWEVECKINHLEFNPIRHGDSFQWEYFTRMKSLLNI